MERLLSGVEMGDLGKGQGEIHFAGSVLCYPFLQDGWTAKHFEVSPSVPSPWSGSAAPSGDGMPKGCPTVHRKEHWHEQLQWNPGSHFSEAFT